jgi:hypothetical protein
MTDKVDSVTLTAVIDQCLENSMDGRFTQAQRTEFLTLAKRLRGSLLNLLSARFGKDTKALNDTNGALADVNTELKNAAASLAKAAQMLKDLNALVGSLDKLIGVAGMFL